MNHSRRVLLVALLGALLAAYALRLQQLGAQSFWYDETVTVYLANQSISGLIAHTARDIHPPLYYLLLHFWVGFMGVSEFAVSYFSLLWGLLLIASSFTLARWLDGRQVALLTVALLALSPFNIWYSQEARMYTMGATLGLWTLLALWQLLRGRRMKKRWMILWLVSAVAGLYTLYYFAFLLLWEAFFVAWWLWRESNPRERWQRWTLLATLLLLLWSPWLPTALHQATTPPVPPWRTAVSPPRMFIETLSALALGQSVDHQLIWPLIALLVPVMLGGLI
ncbi:MAG: glycosyltransferase family 39 protein, partial [Ardenticatenales bacterium]|nr:glycosyltransferase family 39 protein [Ardenticatenales bacterium]